MLPNALLVDPTAHLGKNVSLGAFVQICSGVRVGDRASIGGLTIVPSNVSIGANARLGVSVTFVPSYDSPNAPTVIGEWAEVGENATIFSGVSVGARAVVAPGSLVQRSVPNDAIVEGVPARIVGYVGAKTTQQNSIAVSDPIATSLVQGATLVEMPRIDDIRGSLSVGEFGRNLPFEVKRYFLVFDVPSAETRGEHAHRECHQFLICVRGSCSVVADDGVRRQEFVLNKPNFGLHLRPLVWGIQYKYSPDAVLLVFASHYYEGADYIRDYAEFCKLVGVAV